MPYLKATAISKKYAGFTALNNVNLFVSKGQVVGLLGVNGAGKSSLLKILATLLRPDSGSVFIGDKDALAYPKKVAGRIGFLSEIGPVYKDLTVQEHLNFIAGLKQISSFEKRDEVDRVMRLTRITARSEFLVGNLSKGLQKRVALSACFLGRPSLLLMDEPSSGLDPMESAVLRRLILAEKNNNTAVVFSTHVVSELEAVADEAVVIHSGKDVERLERNNYLLAKKNTINYESGWLVKKNSSQTTYNGEILGNGAAQNVSSIKKIETGKRKKTAIIKEDAAIIFDKNSNKDGQLTIGGDTNFSFCFVSLEGDKKNIKKSTIDKKFIFALEKQLRIWNKKYKKKTTLEVVKKNEKAAKINKTKKVTLSNFNRKEPKKLNENLERQIEVIISIPFLLANDKEKGVVDELVSKFLRVGLQHNFSVRNFQVKRIGLAELFEKSIFEIL